MPFPLIPREPEPRTNTHPKKATPPRGRIALDKPYNAKTVGQFLGWMNTGDHLRLCVQCAFEACVIMHFSCPFVTRGHSCSEIGRGGRQRIDPEEMYLAVEWLKIRDPEHAVSFDAVLAKHGRPKKGEEKGTTGTFKRGGNPDYTLACLKREHPDLFKRVVAKEVA